MSGGSLVWFARHELRLAWRDLAALALAGGRRRAGAGLVILVLVAAILHLFAFNFVAGALSGGIDSDKPTLVFVTGAACLSWCLILSQAIESVTRAFYARGDLELILTSPADARALFAIRILAIGASSSGMAMLLASPVVNVLVVLDGPGWLLVHGAVAAMGFAAAALATAATAGLFGTIGPRRTRLAAQVAAAIVGAAFAIAVQAAAILSFDDPSRFALLSSGWLVERAPPLDSIVWWPARALLGDPSHVAGMLAGSLALLAAIVAVVAPGFGTKAIAAAGSAASAAAGATRPARFRRREPARLLREKEWTLLARDPWLVSQTLMQILYLLPAALLLWRSFGEEGRGVALLVPVLVMAAGQLAGGLAWLAVSGEDAPDLVMTAPVEPWRIVRAKVEAVLGAVGVVAAPLLVGVALVSPQTSLVAAIGIAASAASATAIQLWFRSQARRSQFRRRQTASRIATFAEAFSSILWACVAALAAQGVWLLAAIVGAICAVMLLGVRALSPRAA